MTRLAPTARLEVGALDVPGHLMASTPTFTSRRWRHWGLWWRYVALCAAGASRKLTFC